MKKISGLFIILIFIAVTWQGKVIYDEDIDIQADDCGDRILLQAA